MSWGEFGRNFAQAIPAGVAWAQQRAENQDRRAFTTAGEILAQAYEFDPYAGIQTGALPDGEGSTPHPSNRGFDGNTWESYKRQYMQAISRIGNPQSYAAAMERFAQVEQQRVMSYLDSAIMHAQSGNHAEAQRMLLGVSAFMNPGVTPEINYDERSGAYMVANYQGNTPLGGYAATVENLMDLKHQMVDFTGYRQFAFDRQRHADSMSMAAANLAQRAAAAQDAAARQMRSDDIAAFGTAMNMALEHGLDIAPIFESMTGRPYYHNQGALNMTPSSQGSFTQEDGSVVIPPLSEPAPGPSATGAPSAPSVGQGAVPGDPGFSAQDYFASQMPQPDPPQAPGPVAGQEPAAPQPQPQSPPVAGAGAPQQPTNPISAIASQTQQQRAAAAEQAAIMQQLEIEQKLHELNRGDWELSQAIVQRGREVFEAFQEATSVPVESLTGAQDDEPLLERLDLWAQNPAMDAAATVLFSGLLDIDERIPQQMLNYIALGIPAFVGMMPEGEEQGQIFDIALNARGMPVVRTHAFGDIAIAPAAAERLMIMRRSIAENAEAAMAQVAAQTRAEAAGQVSRDQTGGRGITGAQMPPPPGPPPHPGGAEWTPVDEAVERAASETGREAGSRTREVIQAAVDWLGADSRATMDTIRAGILRTGAVARDAASAVIGFTMGVLEMQGNETLEQYMRELDTVSAQQWAAANQIMLQAYDRSRWVGTITPQHAEAIEGAVAPYRPNPPLPAFGLPSPRSVVPAPPPPRTAPLSGPAVEADARRASRQSGPIYPGGR